MTIHDIYTEVRARGLVRSLRQFSRDFLGRAPNYAADRGLSRCSAGALLHLYRGLTELRQADLAAAAFERLLEAEADATAPRMAVR
jgi:hypothetical protein